MKSSNTYRRSLKALLVEDNVDYRRMLSEILRSRFPEIRIFEAEKGGEAMECIRVAKPQLVFMDIQLSGENGLQITRKIKRMDSTMEVVILTNMDIQEYRQAALDLGADCYIYKGSSHCNSDIVACTEAALRRYLKPH